MATASVAREFVAEFRQGELAGLVPSADGKMVVISKDSTDAYAGQGQLLSAVRSPGRAFNNVVLSWTANSPAATGLSFAVRVRAGEEWSGWYTLGTWRGGRGASVRGQADAWGKVDVDTLVLSRPADAYQYRVSLESSQPAATPALRSVSVATADTSRAPAGPPVALAQQPLPELAVPVESQAIQDPAVAWSICSPTSLTMILRYYGVNTTPKQVYTAVRDGGSGIFGNWPLNTAYAGELGFDAYVARLYSLDQLRAEIQAGHPVGLSIKYKAGELPGAALDSTSGHLVVLRGFTPDGKAVLNDPAAPNLASVRRVVNAQHLESVWLRSGGIAYVVTR
ncbi:MAG: C39 family peptidase [Chloroflexota bacterium]